MRIHFKALSADVVPRFLTLESKSEELLENLEYIYPSLSIDFEEVFSSDIDTSKQIIVGVEDIIRYTKGIVFIRDIYIRNNGIYFQGFNKETKNLSDISLNDILGVVSIYNLNTFDLIGEKVKGGTFSVKTVDYIRKNKEKYVDKQLYKVSLLNNIPDVIDVRGILDGILSDCKSKVFLDYGVTFWNPNDFTEEDVNAFSKLINNFFERNPLCIYKEEFLVNFQE